MQLVLVLWLVLALELWLQLQSSFVLELDCTSRYFYRKTMLVFWAAVVQPSNPCYIVTYTVMAVVNTVVDLVVFELFE